MKRLRCLLYVYLLILSVLASAASADNSRQQPVYSRPDDASLLEVIKVPPHPAGVTLGWTFAPLGSYATGRSKGSEEILVSRGKKQALKVQVPAFMNRNLESRWLNSKLLYLEIWFNPHNGAYWIYDVEAERVITHELMNDGM